MKTYLEIAPDGRVISLRRELDQQLKLAFRIVITAGSLALCILIGTVAKAQTVLPSGYSLDQVAELHSPAHKMIQSTKVKLPDPAFTQLLPAKILWSRNLLKAVSHECETFIGKYDKKYAISKEDPHDYSACVIGLYDAAGGLRWVYNRNDTFNHSARKRNELKVYLGMSNHGEHRFGVYTTDQLLAAGKAFN
jgi:hypothetical protein